MTVAANRRENFEAKRDKWDNGRIIAFARSDAQLGRQGIIGVSSTSTIASNQI
jgi:hypothetical protein